MDGEATEQDTGTAVPARRNRLVLAGGLALLALLVAGFVVAAVVHDRNEDAPVRAVRAYVDAIARGDARAANGMVDPAVDRALLTDDVLRSAEERMTVDEVALEFGEDVAADVVEVRVEYRVRERTSSALLRVQRAGATAGVLHEWRVLDPLLVPVEVQTLEPRLDTARLGGATIPVGGPTLGGFPQHRVHAYPGAYELRGIESRYLAAERKTVDVAHLGSTERPLAAEPLRVELSYPPTAELTAAVDARLAEHLAACFAGTPQLPAGCPLDAYAYRERGPRLEGTPRTTLRYYQVEHVPGSPPEPALGFTAEGFFRADDGGHRSYLVGGRVLVSPADEVTVTFTS